MSVTEAAFRGAVGGSVVGGVIGVMVAPIVGCAGFAFTTAVEVIQKKQLKNKNSLWDNPFVITPIACGIASAAIGTVTSVAQHYLFS